MSTDPREVNRDNMTVDPQDTDPKTANFADMTNAGHKSAKFADLGEARFNPNTVRVNPPATECGINRDNMTVGSQDAPRLVALMAKERPAVMTLPQLAELVDWPSDRIADALADAVASGDLVEWPECSRGPAVMLANPTAHGLRLEPTGEANQESWCWSPIGTPERDPGWKADTERKRRTTRTFSETAAISEGWRRPLDSCPDPAQADPATIAERREELEAALRAAAPVVSMRNNRCITDLLPQAAKGDPAKEPGRPHRRRETSRPEKPDAWCFLAHGTPWVACQEPAPSISRRDQPPGLVPRPHRHAVPANLRTEGVPNSCPHCRGLDRGASTYCLYCDSAPALDAAIGMPAESLRRQAEAEVKKWDAERANEAKKKGKGRKKAASDELVTAK